MASFDIGATPPVAVQLPTVQPAAQTAAPAAATPAPAVTSISTAAASTAATQVQTSVSAGDAPIDDTRVDEIRKALQRGTYPLVPTKIGDAMVAAGLMLRKVG